MWPIRAQPGDLVKMVQPPQLAYTNTHTHNAANSQQKGNKEEAHRKLSGDGGSNDRWQYKSRAASRVYSQSETDTSTRGKGSSNCLT